MRAPLRILINTPTTLSKSALEHAIKLIFMLRLFCPHENWQTDSHLIVLEIDSSDVWRAHSRKSWLLRRNPFFASFTPLLNITVWDSYDSSNDVSYHFYCTRHFVQSNTHQRLERRHRVSEFYTLLLIELMISDRNWILIHTVIAWFELRSCPFFVLDCIFRRFSNSFVWYSTI